MNKKSRTYKTARNIAAGLGAKIVTTILTFVGRRVFLQVFSLDYVGIMGLFGGILTMLSLADLGIETAMIFSYYKPLAEGDVPKLAALSNFYRRAYNTIAAVVAGLGLVVLPFLRFLVNTDQEIPHLEVYYLITLVDSVVTYLFVYKSAIIRADQKGYMLNRITIWSSVIRLALQITALYTTRNFMVYCSVSIIATLTYNLFISRVANREYPQLKRKAELDPDERKDIFQQIKSVFIYRLAIVAAENTDNILISTIVSTTVLGLYGNYATLVTNITFIVGILFSSLIPSVGNLLVKESAEQRHHVFSTMQTISYWVAGVFSFCFYFLMDDFIALWIGPEYVFDEFTKLAILLVFYLGITQYPVRAFRSASGLFERIKYIMLVTAAINLALSILLGLWLGVAGILIATFISKVCTHVWYEPILLYKDFFHEKVKSYFIYQIVNFALVVALVAILGYLAPTFETTTWLRWAEKGFVCFAIINAVYLLMFYRTAEFADIKMRVKHLLRPEK